LHFAPCNEVRKKSCINEKDSAFNTFDISFIESIGQRRDSNLNNHLLDVDTFDKCPLNLASFPKSKIYQNIPQHKPQAIVSSPSDSVSSNSPNSEHFSNTNSSNPIPNNLHNLKATLSSFKPKYLALKAKDSNLVLKSSSGERLAYLQGLFCLKAGLFLARCLMRILSFLANIFR